MIKVVKSRRNYNNPDGTNNYNSSFSKKVHETLSNNFTYTDVDGMILNYKVTPNRLIFIESKREFENLTEGESILMSRLKLHFLWSEYDSESGVFTIKEKKNNWELVDIYERTLNGEMFTLRKKNVLFAELDSWFSGKQFLNKK